jgi:hypothetical protein
VVARRLAALRSDVGPEAAYISTDRRRDKRQRRGDAAGVLAKTLLTVFPERRSICDYTNRRESADSVGLAVVAVLI